MPASANWPDSVMMTPTLMVPWALAEAVAAISAAALSSMDNDWRMKIPPVCGAISAFGATVMGAYRKVNLARRRRQTPPHRRAAAHLGWVLGRTMGRLINP